MAFEKVEIEAGQIWVTRSGEQVLIEHNPSSELFPWTLKNEDDAGIGSVTQTGNEFANDDEGANDLMHLVGLESKPGDRRTTRDPMAQISGPLRRKSDWPSVAPPVPDLASDAETFRNSLPAPMDDSPRSNSALSIQIAGSHYKNFVIQPVEFIHRNGIGFPEGNAIKYLCRWREKGGVKDLEKAKHYIDLLIEMENLKGA